MDPFNNHFVNRSFFFPVILFTVLLLSLGCNGDNRRAVTGQVALNGEPLPLAMVQFIPLDQTVLNTRTAAISNRSGKFSIPKDRGLEPGEYIVTVFATVEYDRLTKDIVTVDTPPTRVKSKVLTPPQYNDKSELRFTVSPKGSNHFTCDVISKVKRTFED